MKTDGPLCSAGLGQNHFSATLDSSSDCLTMPYPNKAFLDETIGYKCLRYPSVYLRDDKISPLVQMNMASQYLSCGVFFWVGLNISV